jgi:hypothetical protein
MPDESLERLLASVQPASMSAGLPDRILQACTDAAKRRRRAPRLLRWVALPAAIAAGLTVAWIVGQMEATRSLPKLAVSFGTPVLMLKQVVAEKPVGLLLLEDGRCLHVSERKVMVRTETSSAEPNGPILLQQTGLRELLVTSSPFL